MKNYFEFRGAAQQLTFDPISKQFVSRTLIHPFPAQQDPLEKQILADLGIDEAALRQGTIKSLP